MYETKHIILMNDNGNVKYRLYTSPQYMYMFILNSFEQCATICYIYKTYRT